MPLNFLRYKHARFSARFPDSYRYSRSHYWMAPVEGGVWRVGFTKFATRMLGELVDCDWKPEAGGAVEPGQIIGWVEGFKAASDVYSVMLGQFVEGNPILRQDACIVRSDPYEQGWLYAVKGEPELGDLSAEEYIQLLDGTIKKMAETMYPDEG
jgi:glycine cleavage system H protein